MPDLQMFCPVHRCRCLQKQDGWAQIQQSIRNLHVRCPYAESGCGWEGQLPFVKDHAYKCLFTPVEVCSRRAAGCRWHKPFISLYDEEQEGDNWLSDYKVCPECLVCYDEGESHHCVEECEYCQKQIPAMNFEQHLQLCSVRYQPCLFCK